MVQGRAAGRAGDEIEDGGAMTSGCGEQAPQRLAFVESRIQWVQVLTNELPPRPILRSIGGSLFHPMVDGRVQFAPRLRSRTAAAAKPIEVLIPDPGGQQV